MPETYYPIEGIILPPNKNSVRLFHGIAVAGAVISSIIGIYIALSNLPLGLAILLGSITVFIEKISKHLPKQWFLSRILSLIAGLGILFVSIYLFITNSFNPKNTVAITTFLVGLALLANTTGFVHRHRFSQSLLVFGLFCNTFQLLDMLYRAMALNNSLFFLTRQFTVTLCLILLGQSLLFAKPARGIMSLFTTDSPSSVLALRFLFYIIFVPPAFGLAILLGEAMGIFHAESRLAIAIGSLMVMSVIATWLNTKLLYRVEQERYIMKEALRVHNINLETSASDLSSKIHTLEEEKQAVTDKIRNQKHLQDIEDLMG